MADAILTLNAGSSSIKVGLFEVTGGGLLQQVSRGQVEGIGSTPHFIAQDERGRVPPGRDRLAPGQTFQALLESVIGWAESQLGADALIAVGHRVVHGGADHIGPELVSDDLLAALDRLAPLAPLHEPHNIAPIRAIAAARPGLPQVVCFDTAFHHTMPKVATRFALPRDYEEAGVRRYGFHGLSYEYIASRLRDIAPTLLEGRVIVAHLGNGASLCAMRQGRSIDTTMGFTTLDGLVMGTRCGNLDPGVVLYLQRERKLTVPQVEDVLYCQSGLLGVSAGIASDMRALLASKDARAGEAIDLFVFRIAREIGALASSLGGLDGLVFTAGIGEHAPEIRAKVCARLGWLGAELDVEANARDAAIISLPQSRVEIRVTPTDEERVIAMHTLAMLRGVSTI
jgi:acetate kinase